MQGTITQINASPEHGHPLTPRERCELQTGVGMVGDRYAGDGIVSIIEAEAVAQFNEATGLGITPADTGRCLVTEGIRLNDLEGCTFSIGDARLEFFELCEPCAMLGKHLSTSDVSAAEVVKAFVNSCGIRATVLTGGEVTPGTAIVG